MNLVALQYTPEQISQRRGCVRERMLREAPYARQGNFVKLADQDILLLYRLYDEIFFAGKLQPLVMQKSGKPVALKVSGAMTSAGGKTTRYRQRTAIGTLRTWYQIAIASRLLLNSFRPGDRPIHVSGHDCTDRLDAMMRIMEHELIHLLEMLTFGNSSCSQTRFMTLAQRLFGHSHPKHGLVTQRERAATEHQLKTGDHVEFTYEGRPVRGFINRIAVRATVLVHDPRGRRYSDGHTYAKYYIPLARLKKTISP